MDICEKYVGNMKKYVGNMKEYVGNTLKRVKICRNIWEYEQICGSGTWKSEEPRKARYESSNILFSLNKGPGLARNPSSTSM